MFKRFSVFILGALFLILLAEVVLRTASVFNSKPIPFRSLQADQKLVLCLGNSFTEGRGAPAHLSYPAQLERLLQKNFPADHYRVINLGSSGLNTRQTIRQVQKQSHEFAKASLVIVQVGQPNWWNFVGFADYLMKKEYEVSYFYRFYSVFNHFHVFRFAVRLWAPANERTQVKCEENRQADLQEILEEVSWFASREKLKTDEVLERVRRDEKYFLEKNVSDPYGPRYAFLAYLASLFFNDEQKSLGYLKEGILQVDCAPSTFDFNPYAMFRRLEAKWTSDKVKKEATVFKYELDKKYPMKGQWLAGQPEKISAWTKAELKELIALLKTHQTKIIIQNYPPLPAGFYSEEINRILREVAHEEKLPFLDNEKVFSEMWKSGLKRSDYHALDEHLNALGYEVVAQNLLKIIKSL